ncbi:hypothetical protein C8Q77DRAFT_28726 [Trametes polyzona]|nr:hypothetical protein C8Q77DRAFT_28726 [Trametes polyzona]
MAQPRPIDRWVSRGGQFIGSIAMMHADQTAGDIYFENYWHSTQANRRLTVVCMSWGMSLAYLQMGSGPGMWPVYPAVRAIRVQDYGIYSNPTAAILPASIRHVRAGRRAWYTINGQPVRGFRLPWNRRVVIRREDRGPLHYHEHEPRGERQPQVIPPIKSEAVGNHWTFHILTVGPQAQSFRRARAL